MNEKEIEQQLNSEFNDFYNKSYDGKIEIPRNIMEIFKNGVMALAPQYHKINCNKLNVIAHKNLIQLTFGDLKEVITIILNTPFDKIYNDFNEAMENHLKIQRFIICYNNAIDEFDKKQKMKKVSLESLIKGIQPNGNGLHIAN